MFRVNQLAGFGSAKAGVATWTPAQLPGLSFWYDPADLSTLFQDSAGTTTVTANNDPVGLMNDKSGNGYHLSQATSGLRPLWKTSSGLSWLEFDGTDDLLTRSETNVGIASAIIGLNMKTGTASYAGVLNNTIDQASDVDTAFGRNSSLNSWYFGANTPGDVLAGDGTPFWNNKTQTLNISIDTVAVYSTDGTGNTNTLRFPNGVQIGLDRNNAGRYLLGSVYGVIACTGILSGTNRNLAETWMGTRCGLVI